MLIKNEKKTSHHFNFREVYLPVPSLEDVDAQGVDAEGEVRALLVLDVEVVDAVHLQVLGQFQVVQHSLVSGMGNMTKIKYCEFGLLVWIGYAILCARRR